MLLEKAETDWLGTNPIFYNEKNNKISDNILEVIDYDNFSFHAEGLNNYLQFGYSVFGQTMVENVKFLLPNSKIFKENGKIIIEEKDDQVADNLDTVHEKPDDIFEHILEFTRDWSAKQENIILPLSGGFDSRLLSLALRENPKVKSFTYGVSELQSDSQEVINARRVAWENKISWEQIFLGDFHQYNEKWFNLYGVSTHLHGMYQMEFYEKIKKKNSNGSVLSGIIGDLWAGNVELPLVNSPKDLCKLAYAHGMQITADICKVKDTEELKNDFYFSNKDKLNDERWRLIFFARFKMMLLSYLIKVPMKYGFDAWSPFIDEELAISMLNIPSELRKDRKWQREMFSKYGIALANAKENEKIDYSNVLDMAALRHQVLEPLDVKLLSGVIDKNFVDSINRNLKQPLKYFPWYKGTINSTLDIFIHFYNKKIRNAYSHYLVIKPIEMLLKRVEGEIE